MKSSWFLFTVNTESREPRVHPFFAKHLEPRAPVRFHESLVPRVRTFFSPTALHSSGLLPHRTSTFVR